MRLIIAAAAIALSAIPAHATPHNVGQYRMTNNGKLRPVAIAERPRIGRHLTRHASKRVRGHHYARQREQTHERSSVGVIYLPNPPGTWRVHNSCAQRLAAYLGLGPGLDAVITWADRYRRVGGPAVGMAAIRRDRHHIMYVKGGHEGAWRVVDFNSTGHHENREYTIATFHNYFFVDPRSRMASR